MGEVRQMEEQLEMGWRDGTRHQMGKWISQTRWELQKREKVYVRDRWGWETRECVWGESMN